MSIYDIRNTRELRDAYEFLSFEKEIDPDGKIASKIKSAIRKWNNRPEPMERVIKGEFDYVTSLIEFPDEIETEEEAEEFFDDHYRMTYMWSPYDCTGQWFTSRHKCFKRRGKWMCYHWTSCDV